MEGLGKGAALAGVWGTVGIKNRFCPALQARTPTILPGYLYFLQLELPKFRAKPPPSPFSPAEGKSGDSRLVSWG